MVLTKIHRCLSFKQKAWVKPYIEFNTCKRQQATNEFQKAFHKLLNSSFFRKGYGKCAEAKICCANQPRIAAYFPDVKTGF